ncbi:hypothetical protein KQQSB11_350355 [Klebsiella quasipneumoniae subsp. quasipneumoniae]|nr:hypothetical protein KQQSB11_350355 [Klebsiella quasipneumoniae subsp. quasipneumoniae]
MGLRLCLCTTSMRSANEKAIIQFPYIVGGSKANTAGASPAAAQSSWFSDWQENEAEKIRNYLVAAGRDVRGHAAFTERQEPVQSADRCAPPIRSMSRRTDRRRSRQAW